MNRNTIVIMFLSLVFLAGCSRKNQFTIENQALSRTVSIENQQLKTIKLINKRTGKERINPQKYRGIPNPHFGGHPFGRRNIDASFKPDFSNWTNNGIGERVS